MIIKHLDKLSPQQIKDQALQLLGYSNNVLALDKYDFASCLSNFSTILKEHVSKSFNTSLNNSIECMVSPEKYASSIVNSESDNKQSFILAPMSTYNGFFTCLFYKNADNFECILINNDKDYSFESYTIPKNRLRYLTPYLGVFSAPVNKLEHPHDVLLQCTNEPSYVYNFDVKNNYQSPFIDIENGLKYAYCSAISKELKALAFPMDNISTHIQYLANIKKDCPDLKRYIDNLSEVYSVNELFKNFCINNPNASFEEKLQQFKLNFYPNLPKSLNTLDLENLRDNFDFLHTLCVNDERNSLVFFASAIENVKPFLTSGGDIEDFKDIFEICQKYFPNVSSQLSKFCAQSYYQLGNDKFNKGDYVNALKLYANCLMFNPNHALCHYKRGICFVSLNLFENANECFEKATRRCPNFVDFRYNNAFTLYKLGKENDALAECTKVLSNEPKHIAANKLQKLLLTKTNKLENNAPKREI